MRRRTIGIAMATAMLASTLGMTATQAGGSIVMVDDDGRATPASCNAGGPGSAETTVQGGVDAAPAGGTVLVCPGTYLEQVEIAGKNGLTVRSTRPWKATIQAPNELDTPSIVGIYDADDTTFRGFKVITRTTEGCDSPEIGIHTVGARNTVIRGNRVRNFGQTFGACAFTVGIMAGYTPAGIMAASAPAGLSDPTTTATIAYNAVRDHLFIGIAAVSTTFGKGLGGSTRATIAHNSVRYFHTRYGPDECFVASARLSAGDARTLRRGIAGLSPAGPGGLCPAVGIYQGAGTSDSPIPGASGDIKANRILSGPDAVLEPNAGAFPETPLQLVGILVVDQAHADGKSRVLDNLAFRNFIDIMATDARGILIRGNRTRDSLFGILVTDTVGGTVRNNDATGSIVGIFVADEPPEFTSQPYYQTRDLSVSGNDARGNLDASCVDETTGGGTQGTANTWSSNKGEPGSSDSEGICGAVSPP